MVAVKILAVDDEEIILQMLQARLSAHGYDVITAGDGSEGLLRARKEKPDLIILDIQMPKMDGLQVLSKLKGMPGITQVPVIMLTTKGQKANILEAEKLKAEDFLIKPFKAEELLEVIQKALQQFSP